MTEPTLMPSMTDAQSQPRRSFHVHTFTAIYDAIEDRVRLNAVDKAGVKQSILLTRRMLDQIVPVIAKDLEAKTPQGVPAQIVQSMTQERARQMRRKASVTGNVAPPVQREAQTPHWLCKTVHFKPVPNGLIAVLTDDSSVDAVLPLAELNLRALLDVLRAAYAKASWHPRVFPEWLQAEHKVALGQGVQVRLN